MNLGQLFTNASDFVDKLTTLAVALVALLAALQGLRVRARNAVVDRAVEKVEASMPNHSNAQKHSTAAIDIQSKLTPIKTGTLSSETLNATIKKRVIKMKNR